MEPESWYSASGVSDSCALGEGVVSIVSLSAMLFMFPLENISVSSFSPNDRKWASGAMAEAALTAVAEVAVVETEEKTAAYRVV